jgi:hypothetical protein
LNRNSEGFPIEKSRINKSREDKYQYTNTSKISVPNTKISERGIQGLSYKYPSKQTVYLNYLNKD